jgi:hypothetical protein
VTPVPFLRLRSADQREYRRGMVLGLTMAEIAILLIFLLMLAAAAASLRRGEQAEAGARTLGARAERAEAEAREQRARAERAEALAEALSARLEVAERERDNARMAAGHASTLLRRLDELTEANRRLERERDALRSDASVQRERAERAEASVRTLSARLEVVERERDNARAVAGSAAALARRLDELTEANRRLEGERNALRSERDMLSAELDARARAVPAPGLAEARRRLGLAPDASEERVAGALARRLDELADAERLALREMEVLRGQLVQLQRQLAQAGGQAGSGIPHCWPTRSGGAEYMLRISMHDGGMVSVSDRLPMAQPSDPGWRLVAGLPRDRMMSMQELRAAVQPLVAHGTSKNCRYAVETIDMTGPSNKLGYKTLQSGIWEIFYQREIRR